MCWGADTFIDSYVGMFIGGGRDNKLHGNHCPSTHTCVHVDNRGMNWEQTSCNKSVCVPASNGYGMCDPLGLEKVMKYPAWVKAWPELSGPVKDACVPVGNEVVGNDYSQGEFIDQPASVTTAWKMKVAGNKKV
eukprot:COSAG02_NODE_16491_length_1079_cov_1.526531_1_plen_134_part_00